MGLGDGMAGGGGGNKGGGRFLNQPERRSPRRRCICMGDRRHSRIWLAPFALRGDSIVRGNLCGNGGGEGDLSFGILSRWILLILLAALVRERSWMKDDVLAEFFAMNLILVAPVAGGDPNALVGFMNLRDINSHFNCSIYGCVVSIYLHN